MGDQAALQEAIKRARQMAAKMTQSAPVKRSPVTSGPSDHSGPVRVTLAYEKPANHNPDSNSTSSTKQHDRHRSSSRDYNRNERDSRDYKSSDLRDNNHNHRDSNASSRSSQSQSGYQSQSQHADDSRSTQLVSSHHQPPQQPSHLSGPPNPRSGEEKIELIIPHSVIGLVIGKGGENIKRIQNESGATVRVDPNTIDEKGNKLCTITGTKNAVDEAHAQVANVIESAAQNKRPRMQNDSSSDSYRMKIPAHRTGAIIGKGGETIKSIKQQSGCEIELDKNSKECNSDESVFVIRGSQDKIQLARSLIEQRLARGARDGPIGGGGGGGRDYQESGGSSRSSRGGVATGANAAPVAQFTDLPTPYSAQANQPNSADMTASWAAYMAQYSSMFNQPGAQPNAQATATATTSLGAYGTPGTLLTGVTAPNSATNLLPTMTAGSVPSTTGQQQQQVATAGVTAPTINPAQPSQAPGRPTQSQDYTDQWIEFYLANGRPDYAEQMIQMKKEQQQAQQSQQT